MRDEPRIDSVLKHTQQLSTLRATLNATSLSKTVPFGKRRRQSSETMQLKKNAEKQIEEKIAKPNKATRL